MDGETTLRSARAEGSNYAHVLFRVDDLDPLANHTLTFTNMENGKWFGFDYALVTSGPANTSSVSPPFTRYHH